MTAPAMSACSISCGMKPSKKAPTSSAVKSCPTGEEPSETAGLEGAADALVSVALGACAKSATQQKIAPQPSQNILERIDFFTVKASRFLWSRSETTAIPKTG